MEKRYSWIDIIMLFWAYFMGILLTSELYTKKILIINNSIVQGLLAVIVGFSFAYLLSKLINRHK